MCVSFINYTCPTAITQNRQSQYTCGILLLIPVCPVICDIIVIIQKIQSSLKILECLLICKLHISLRNHGNLCFCNRQTCFFQSFANCTEIIWSSENLITNAQIGDSTNAEFLQSLGIGNYDICFVTIGGSFQNSLETTSLLKELGAKLVISRAERDVQEKFLLRNGADKVVYPEKQVAKWASIRYTDDHILDYMEVDASHAIFEVEVPEEWVGKTVGELDIRKRYNINILAVKNEEEFSIAISPETYFAENDKLLVLGEYRALQKCFRI